MKKINILAFETSCDDTSVAIVDENYQVIANFTFSQLVHNEFGGIVPELASRLHMKKVVPLLDEVLKQSKLNLDEMDAIAVSVNPGLIGALLVGVSFAKSLAFSLNKPFIAVNHIVGHIYSNKIENPDLKPPFLALIISGGHTELVHFTSATEFKIVGRTLDDAAGEAFDKTAKLLSLGYPGGPQIDRISKNGNPDFYEFPFALNRKNNFNFSYSGLKTSIAYYIKDKSNTFISENKANIAASVQKAIVKPLLKKTISYAVSNNIKQIVLAGGVSANSFLRSVFIEETQKKGIQIYMPSLKYCMDNAAMIGAAAVDKFTRKEFANLDLNAFSKKGLRIL